MKIIRLYAEYVLHINAHLFKCTAIIATPMENGDIADM